VYVVLLANPGGCAVDGVSLRLTPAGIAGSNSAENMDMSLLCIAGYRSLRQADHSSRGVRPNVVCLSVIMISR